MVEALGQRLGFLEIHVRDVYQPEFVMLVVMTVEHPRVCKFYNHVSFFSAPTQRNPVPWVAGSYPSAPKAHSEK